MTDPFGWFEYIEETQSYAKKCHGGKISSFFNYNCGHYLIRHNLTIDDIRQSFSHRLNANNTLFVIQTNSSQKTFKRELIYVRISIEKITFDKSGLYFRESQEPTEDSPLRLVKNIDGRHQLIGLFMDEKHSLYVLLKEEKAIRYCLISDVSDQWIHN